MNNPNQNLNCDNHHCRDAHGEVRLLPMGGGGNAILCIDCFNFEINWRKERNKDLGKDCQFKIPTWEQLTVYI